MNDCIFDRRRAGLLAPVYALRHAEDFGIGDTISVKEAIDFCSTYGFSVLQMLPIFETINDPSPYSPVSSHALSPSLLSLTPETVPGLDQEVIDRICPPAWRSELRKGNVRYHVIEPLKYEILAAAYRRFASVGDPVLREEFERFKSNEASWLDHYTLYRVLVGRYRGDTRWADWRPEHRSFPDALHWLDMEPDNDVLITSRDRFAFIQWIAARQWNDVRQYADARGVRLMGDLPFGMSPSSCDVWAEPSLFDLEWSMGTRPLAHFDTSKDAERWGQNWGFPPYRWENHRSSSFRWFTDRLRWVGRLFHGCRIDHLRGYFRAYMFPWPGGITHVEFAALDEAGAAERTGGLLPRFVPGPDDDPVAGEINRLQGNELIEKMIESGGSMDFVAEIMGDMPDYMSDTLQRLQLANLAFPQLLLGEDGRIIAQDRFRELSLVSYANHDNAPLAQFYPNLAAKADLDPNGPEAGELHRLLEFIGWSEPAPPSLEGPLLEKFHEALLATSARLAVLLCSDLFGLPIRFNLPGSYGEGAWSHRLPWTLSELSADPKFGAHVRNLRDLITRNGRLPN
jgi:4-alpha-glucanotransferase